MRDFSDSPLVSIIAVNYNGADVLAHYMAAVRAAAYTPWELIIVDNASTDGSRALLEAELDVRLVTSDSNIGFGRACNLGAAVARGDLFFFMNPDAAIERDALSTLVRSVAATPEVGVICPASRTTWSGDHERARRLEPVAAMPASAMLVTREHWEALGGFDPWIFLYGEDTDLCYRTWLLGRQVLKDWDAVVSHDVGGTGGGHAWSAEQIKNGIYVHIKSRAWPATARYAARMAVKTIVRGIRLRDPSVLSAWTTNVVELPATLRKRRAIRASASLRDRERLEQLAARHASWSRRSWRVRALSGLRRRVGRAQSRDAY